MKKTVPSGRSSDAPVSKEWKEEVEKLSARDTGVLPAVDHVPEPGLYRSELRVFCGNTSTVRTVPSGNSVSPASSFFSANELPVADHVRVPALNNATLLVQQSASMNVPFSSTTPEASPMLVHPAGGNTAVQRLAAGS